MQVRALSKWVHTGPRKIRRYADLIRGKSLSDARAILGVQSSPAAGVLLKTLESAVANAENNHDIDAEDLMVYQAVADGALTTPRMRPRARGRADRTQRRTSHVTVIVSDDGGDRDEE